MPFWTLRGNAFPFPRSSLFAKTLFQTTHFRLSYRPFREQVRSYGLRPESKAYLCITPSGTRVICYSGLNKCACPARYNDDSLK
ncbi:hypothetical protein GIV52_03190 [Pseudomonas syringae]|uniref:Uncharacterized protein n=1 Tax=Pseudomonas syringae TaxID=317 RepID=A0A9Q4FJ67_PSESX|nr:hypothetical protein [Pseudomonas syringae]MCF5471697.1 hypothetical protein [Pseudomonas syringae]MCF5482674.1 hypothetical protein [Pseudomonas syringae]MCF5489049.1 hypothetical protein [Pseudomonas syringae]MCF5491962.1 hypothetical protein [Pseudomonas syringae]